ncbi:hypothetical protein GCM10023178_68150 [Actinomadura luteofluorescens]
MVFSATMKVSRRATCAASRPRKHARPAAPDAGPLDDQDKPNDKTITLSKVNLDAFVPPDDAVSPAADTLTDKAAQKVNRPRPPEGGA